MEQTGIDPSEITFEKQLSYSRFSVIFVTIRGKTCVMKVVGSTPAKHGFALTRGHKYHHGRGPKQYYESPDRETNFHVWESTAYRRLKEFGLCDRGIIPQFYGTIENLDPKLCQPHLKAFLNDEYIPNAILLEYIPNMREFHWTNYTKQRMENFTRGINKIHKIRKVLV